MIAGGAAAAGVQGEVQVSGSYSGGDGGASGGWSNGGNLGGAVGGNGAAPAIESAICNRFMATDISGLFAALTLAGVATVDTIETCALETAPFGAGGYDEKYAPSSVAGLGGGGVIAGEGIDGTPGGAGAVVLYFT